MKVTRDEFRTLFGKAVEQAALRTANNLNVSTPDSYAIELHGAGYHGPPLNFEDALEKLYISDERFYVIIDVAIKAIGSKNWLVFVNASDRKPAPFENTWDPNEFGPFKPLSFDCVGSLEN